MKFELNEYAECFELSMEAETTEEAAKLVRLGMNATKQVRGVHAFVYRAGVTGSVVLGKRSRERSSVGTN